MKISSKTWQNYIKKLARINVKAAGDVVTYMVNHDVSTYEGTKALIDYAYAVSTKYGEAAAELSCQMYDAIATVSKASVPAAEPAATATYGEIAKTIYGTLASTKNPDAVGAAVGRSVKLASVDTLQKNALRDGAEWAWVPAGDTCPFCLMLASRGWVKASKKALKNGHADHIHNNCDCTYCVRFDHETTVEGYDPEGLYDQYINAGDTPGERLNALRRQHYAANRDYINAQKRAAYARRKGFVLYEGIPRNWDYVGELSADEILRKVNPKYTRDLPQYLHGTKDDYTHNCANTVVAYEMRKRGYDVTACSVGENRRLRKDPFSAWVYKGDRQPIRTKGSGLEEILEYMDKKENGTRIEITVQFPKNAYQYVPDGHAFVAERINGETVFVNPQTNSPLNKNIFNRVAQNDTMFMRIDDLEISDRGVTACKRV